MSDDLRERLVRLETQMEHVRKAIDDLNKEVKTLVDVLNQARGARVLAGIMWAAVTGVVGAAAFKLLTILLPLLPK